MFRVWLRYLECLVFGHHPAATAQLVDLGTHLVQITVCPNCGRRVA